MFDPIKHMEETEIAIGKLFAEAIRVVIAATEGGEVRWVANPAKAGEPGMGEMVGVLPRVEEPLKHHFNPIPEKRIVVTTTEVTFYEDDGTCREEQEPDADWAVLFAIRVEVGSALEEATLILDLYRAACATAHALEMRLHKAVTGLTSVREHVFGILRQAPAATDDAAQERYEEAEEEVYGDGDEADPVAEETEKQVQALTEEAVMAAATEEGLEKATQSLDTLPGGKSNPIPPGAIRHPGPDRGSVKARKRRKKQRGGPPKGIASPPAQD